MFELVLLLWLIVLIFLFFLQFLLFLQRTAGELTEQIVSHLQLVDSRRKRIGLPSSIGKEIKERIRTILKSITRGLLPSAYFKVIIKLLDHASNNVKRKVMHEVFVILKCLPLQNFNLVI